MGILSWRDIYIYIDTHVSSKPHLTLEDVTSPKIPHLKPVLHPDHLGQAVGHCSGCESWNKKHRVQSGHSPSQAIHSINTDYSSIYLHPSSSIFIHHVSKPMSHLQNPQPSEDDQSRRATRAGGSAFEVSMKDTSAACTWCPREKERPNFFHKKRVMSHQRSAVFMAEQEAYSLLRFEPEFFKFQMNPLRSS